METQDLIRNADRAYDEAVAMGDTAKADEIAGDIRQMLGSVQSVASSSVTQPPQPPQPQYEPIDPTEGMSTPEKWAVAVGRGASEIGQGVKQIGYGIGESMGLVDEGTQDAYTAEKTEEKERYDRTFRSRNPMIAGIGGTIGNMAAVPIPGVGGLAAKAGLAGRTALMAGVGGIQAGAEFVPEGGSRLRNAGIGAGFGAGGQLLSDAVGSGVNKFINARAGNTRLSGTAKQAADYAESNKLPIAFDDLTDSGSAKWVGTQIDNVPLTGGKTFRKGQQALASNHAEKIASRFGNAELDSLHEVVNDSMRAKLVRFKDVSNRFYGKAFDELDVGAFDVQNAKKMAADLIHEQTAKGGSADVSLITELNKIIDTPPGDFGFWHEIRSDLSGKISDSYKGGNQVISTRSAGKLQQVKKAIDADMEGVARDVGGRGYDK